MALTIGDLVARLGLDTSAFSQGASEATRTLSRMEKVFGEFSGPVKGAAIALAAVGAAAATVGATAFVMMKHVADTGDELNKLSQRIGLSVEKLSGYRVAAELADVSLQEFGQSMALLSRRMQDASQGQAEAADAFRSLGISVTDTTGRLRPVDAIMREIADKFSGAEDGAAKTAMAMDLMGRAGARMIPYMNQGAAGIDELVREAERLGVVWTKDAAVAAEAFNEGLTRVGLALEGVKIAIFRDVIPAMMPYVDAVTQWVVANRELIATGIRDFLVELAAASKALLPILPPIAKGIHGVVVAVTALISLPGQILTSFQQVWYGLLEGSATAVAKLLELASSLPIIGKGFALSAQDAQTFADEARLAGQEAVLALEKPAKAQGTLTTATAREGKKRTQLTLAETKEQLTARAAAEKAIGELRVQAIVNSEEKILAERDAAIAQAQRQYEEDLRAFGQTLRGKEVAQARLEASRSAIAAQTDQKMRDARIAAYKLEVADYQGRADEMALVDSIFARDYETEQRNLADLTGHYTQIRINEEYEWAQKVKQWNLEITDAAELAANNIVRAEAESVEERIKKQSEAFLTFKRNYDDEVALAVNANLLKLKLYQDDGTKQLAIAAGTYQALEAYQKQNLSNAILVLQKEAEQQGSVWLAMQAGALKTYADLGTFWGNITKGFEQTFANVNRSMSDLFFDVFTGKFEGLKDVLDNFKNAMLRTFSDILAAEATKGILGLFGIGTGGIGGGGQGAAGGILSGIGSALGGVWDWVGGGIKDIGNSIGSFLGFLQAGLWEVPDLPGQEWAVLHPGEMVLPPDVAAAVRTRGSLLGFGPTSGTQLDIGRGGAGAPSERGAPSPGEAIASAISGNLSFGKSLAFGLAHAANIGYGFARVAMNPTVLGAVSTVLGAAKIAESINAMGLRQMGLNPEQAANLAASLRGFAETAAGMKGLQAAAGFLGTDLTGLVDRMARDIAEHAERTAEAASFGELGPVGVGSPSYGIGEEAASGMFGGGAGGVGGGSSDSGGRDAGSAGDAGTGTGAESGSGFVASGALFNTRRPTRLTVGEAGTETVAILRNPEEYPLPVGQRETEEMLGGKSGVTVQGPLVHIEHLAVREEADIHRIGEQIAWEIERVAGRSFATR